MDAVIGTWKFTPATVTEMHDFMNRMGAGEFAKDENISSTRFSVAKDGAYYTFSWEVKGMDSKVHRYQPGQTFEIDTPYGPKYQLTIKEECGKFVETYVGADGQGFTTVRTVCGNDMTAVTTFNGQSVTAKLVRV